MSEWAANHIDEQFQLDVGEVAVSLPLINASNQETGGAVTKINPHHALIYVGEQPIRWRADGVDPNATMGFPVRAGETIDFMEPMTDFANILRRIKFVRDATATQNATLECALFN